MTIQSDGSHNFDLPEETFSINRNISVCGEDYLQNTNKSVTDADGRYSYLKFSPNEVDTIYNVLKTTDRKYIPQRRSIGMINEIDGVIYKASSILTEIVIQEYGNSNDPVDCFAVALAYKNKGSYFRKEAIRYFEKSICEAEKKLLGKYIICLPLFVYSTFGNIYAEVKDYAAAVSLFEKALELPEANKERFAQQIQTLKSKIQYPAQREYIAMKSEKTIERERQLRAAAIYFKEQYAKSPHYKKSESLFQKITSASISPLFSEYSELPRYFLINGKQYDIDKFDDILDMPLIYANVTVKGKKYNMCELFYIHAAKCSLKRRDLRSASLIKVKQYEEAFNCGYDWKKQ